jgi:glycosyltransferase involved in cell wall biosynthesis
LASLFQASVIIPAYNQRPEFLGAAINSALSQTVPVEIIVVDDGSDHGIDSEHPQVRVVSHPRNRGISAALNTGIAAMTTDWFCWLPSDDLYRPEKVEMQRAAMTVTGSFASFHQYYVFSQEPGQPQGVSARWDWSSQLKQRRQLGVGCAINGLTTMIHRSVFEAVGAFDESYRYGQDWEMWARIAYTYEWLPMTDVLAARRQSGENLTAVIEGNAEMRAVRDAEDERIRKRYGV